MVKNKWKLEFDYNKQWQIFQNLHKECYKKNVETSSRPKVRLIEDIPKDILKDIPPNIANELFI